MQQRIHIATTPDKVRLAWARSGSGPVLVKASNWLTHLRHDLESPVWQHWMGFLTEHFDFIRFDERGCGMSDRQVADVSERNWLIDLECVIDAAGIDRPMILLGVSQGAVTAIKYAIKYPERVSKLILYGGYARGWAMRGDDHAQHYRAVLEMVRLGWGNNNPVFRQTFTARFVPEGTHEQLDWFNDLCRETVAPAMAVPLLEARAHADITDLLAQVRVPTQVIHARRDEVVPLSEGRKLASEIAGAEFVELDSRNHVLLAHEPAWRDFQRAVLDFTGAGLARRRPAEQGLLTRRERQILDLLGDGLTNVEIGRQIFLSEKTVRNHLSSVYRKMEVASRAQAITKVRSKKSGDD
jgi:pimeloyl-ACP methyl ester carboxylesterase/DNA-binding CsgD family transcriptional regulator